MNDSYNREAKEDKIEEDIKKAEEKAAADKKKADEKAAREAEKARQGKWDMFSGL